MLTTPGLPISAMGWYLDIARVMPSHRSFTNFKLAKLEKKMEVLIKSQIICV